MSKHGKGTAKIHYRNLKVVHLYRALTELTGLKVAPGESVSERRVNLKAWRLLCSTGDFINTMHLAYTKCFFKSVVLRYDIRGAMTSLDDKKFLAPL